MCVSVRKGLQISAKIDAKKSCSVFVSKIHNAKVECKRPYFIPKLLKNHSLSSRKFLYSPYKRVPTPVEPFRQRGNLVTRLRLSSSYSRTPKKLPPISENVAQKLLFVMEVAQKLLERMKKKFLFISPKVRFVSIFVRFCGVNSVAK